MRRALRIIACLLIALSLGIASPAMAWQAGGDAHDADAAMHDTGHEPGGLMGDCADAEADEVCAPCGVCTGGTSHPDVHEVVTADSGPAPRPEAVPFVTHGVDPHPPRS